MSVLAVVAAVAIALLLVHPFNDASWNEPRLGWPAVGFVAMAAIAQLFVALVFIYPLRSFLR